METNNIPALKAEAKTEVPKLAGAAAEVGKLAPGHTATKYRCGRKKRIIDLNGLSKESAETLAADPNFKVFVKK